MSFCLVDAYLTPLMTGHKYFQQLNLSLYYKPIKLNHFALFYPYIVLTMDIHRVTRLLFLSELYFNVLDSPYPF